MNPNLYNVLSNRVLYHDGSISVDPSNIQKYINVKKLFVFSLNAHIIQYNKNVISTDQIKIKEHLDPLDTSWNIPDKYKQIDILEYVMDKLLDLDELELFESRCRRVIHELHVFKKLNLYPLLQTMIYIIDSFKANDIVWGVGRGSSVSSYVLFLLEVHDVDSILYELDFNEFLGE